MVMKAVNGAVDFKMKINHPLKNKSQLLMLREAQIF